MLPVLVLLFAVLLVLLGVLLLAFLAVLLFLLLLNHPMLHNHNPLRLWGCCGWRLRLQFWLLYYVLRYQITC